VIVLVLAPSMGAAQPLHAQAQPTPGTWIRFVADSVGTRIVGRVVSTTRDSITIQGALPSMSERQIRESTQSTFAISTVRGAEVLTETHGHGFEGFGIGLLAGAAAGALLASGTWDDSPTEPQLFPKGQTIGIMAGLGGILGGVLGAALGHGLRSEVWAPAAGAISARVQKAPRRKGFTAAVSLSIP